MKCSICGCNMKQMPSTRHHNFFWCAVCDRDVKEEKPSWRTVLFPEVPEDEIQ